MYVKGKGKR